jgi:hypothetical protein
MSENARMPARNGNRQSNVLPLRRQPARAPQRSRPRRRRSFPFFSITLVSIMAAGAVMATAFRGDPMRDARDILSWLHGLDSTAVSAQAPAARATGSAADAASDASLKAGIEKMAADMRATKVERHAVLEAARLNNALEKERESAQAAGRDAAPTQGAAAPTQSVAALGKSPADDASDARLTRSISNTGTVGDRPARSPDTAETKKLLERASGLLRLGDVGGARIVLGLAHENGSARATFMLAETYDPLVLSTWSTFGTRADSAKARELYTQAYAAGIIEAKARSDALSK